MVGIMFSILSGCCSVDSATPTTQAPAVRTAAPQRVSTGGGEYPSVSRDGDTIVTYRSIPTGVEATSVLQIVRTAPAEVAVGQEFPYSIKVINLTQAPLDDVVVTCGLPDGVSYKGSTPSAAQAGDMLTWELGTIPGKGSKTIILRAAAMGTGDFTNCVAVSYTQRVCLTVSAVEPKLTLDKSAPAEVLICDTIPITLTVRNPGTGAATGVVVTDTLPAGMKTVDGKSTVTFDVGTLNPGESKQLKLEAKADRTGTYENKAVAKGNGGLSDDAATTTVVRQPVLAIAKTATEMVYEGRPVEYSITVANKGDAVAEDTVVTDTLPKGVSFVSATAGGTHKDGVVTWNLGSLAPNAQKTLGITGKATAQGTQLNRAEAEASCAAASVVATASTQVKGIAAILLEVVDVSDPIEVGGQETYIITATNQGSAVDRNIVVTCTLEDTQSYVSSSGATTGRLDGATVRFAPLAALDAKNEAEWRVVVKAVKAGDVRFSVEMTSDMLGRPVNETESTHQY
jgi:uncharacterized repeat protein (TIGR01451 family)